MQRKLGVKVFTTKTLKTVIETVFPQKMTILTGIITSSVGGSIDLHDYLHRYFLDSFAQISFGVN